MKTLLTTFIVFLLILGYIIKTEVPNKPDVFINTLMMHNTCDDNHYREINTEDLYVGYNTYVCESNLGFTFDTIIANNLKNYGFTVFKDGDYFWFSKDHTCIDSTHNTCYNCSCDEINCK